MKKFFFFSKKIMLLIPLFAFVQASAQTAQDYFNTGVDWYKNKQYDQAIQNLDKAIEMKPDYMEAYQVRSRSFYAIKNYTNAALDDDKAIALEPGNEVNYYNRGNVFNAIRCYDSAMLDYNHAISLKPAYADALLNRGITYGNEKNYDLAIADFNKALSIDSGLYAAYNSRGLAYLYSGQYDLSINDFKKAIASDINKERPAVVVNIIEPLAHLYRFTEAAKYYNQFLSDYDQSYLMGTSWNYFKKYIDAATQNLSKNDYAGALQNLNEAEKLYDTKQDVTGNDDDLANFNGGQNIYGPARTKTSVSDENAKRGYSSILALKGYVLERLQNIAEAKKAYDQSLLINNNQPDVQEGLQRISQQALALIKSDDTPPQINILEPASDKRSISVDDDKTAGATQRIRGQAIDASGIKSIQLNNVFLKLLDNGYFDTTVRINKGVNFFSIVATDKNANSVSRNIQLDAGIPKPATGANADTSLHYSPIYNAILIAESDYADKNIPSLQSPSGDMNKMYNLLTGSYSFDPQNTDTLVNATRTTILEAIIKKANTMSDNDNLLIFYAGHGQMIKQPDNSEEGFLVPEDAVKDLLSTYINSDDLLRTIKYSKAKHILFIADACFAGSLFRDIPSDAPVPVAEAYKDKSRRLLASGNRTTVPDKSVFIEDLRLALQENHQRYITAEQLIDTFKNQYTTSTHLTLQYFPIKDVDDLGGQFVFIRK